MACMASITLKLWKEMLFRCISRVQLEFPKVISSFLPIWLQKLFITTTQMNGKHDISTLIELEATNLECFAENAFICFPS